MNCLSAILIEAGFIDFPGNCRGFRYIFHLLYFFNLAVKYLLNTDLERKNTIRSSTHQGMLNCVTSQRNEEQARGVDEVDRSDITTPLLKYPGSVPLSKVSKMSV